MWLTNYNACVDVFRVSLGSTHDMEIGPAVYLTSENQCKKCEKNVILINKWIKEMWLTF